MKIHTAAESVIAIAVVAGLSLLVTGKSMVAEAGATLDVGAAPSAVVASRAASDVDALTHSVKWDKMTVSDAGPTF